MITLFYNIVTKNLSLNSFDPGAAEYTGPVGADSVQLIIQTGTAAAGSNVLLTGQSVQLLFRDPAAMGAGYLAGPFTLTQGTTADQGFIGSINTNSTPVQTAFKQIGAGETAQEPLNYPALASIVLLPTDGSPGTESIRIAWNLTDNLYRTSAPPADIVAEWSSPAQLQAAIAAAAAAVQPGSSPTFAALTVSGAAHLNGGVDFPTGQQITQNGADIPLSFLVTNVDSILSPVVPGNGQSVRLRTDGQAFEAYTPNSGDGSALTNLNPANLSGPVAIAQGGTGATTAAAALAALGAAPLAGPTFTGTVTIPAGASIAGFAALASPTFTGIVTIPAGANISGYVQSVDGDSPDSSGAITLASDAAANVGSKRTLGTGALQAAPGSDARFSASVTGIRKGAGAGSTDTAAVPGVDIATVHAISYSAGGPSGTGATFTYSGNAQAPSSTIGQGIISDVYGQVYIQMIGSATTGTLLLTIDFATPYTGIPGSLIPLYWPGPLFNKTDGTALPTGGPLYAVLTTTALKFYAGQNINYTGTTIYYCYQYLIPQVVA